MDKPKKFLFGGAHGNGKIGLNPHKKKFSWRRVKIVLSLLVCMALVFGLVTFITAVGAWFDDNKIVGHQMIKVELNPPFTIEERESAPRVVVSPLASPSATPTPKLLNMIKPKQAYAEGSRIIKGKISHYSRAGCLGCDPNFIMANGEPLDDSKPTIAVVPGALPMNTRVLVTNLDNGKSIEARVTDTGGFAKYNRVADLSLAVGNYLGTKTDQSEVEIKPI